MFPMLFAIQVKFLSLFLVMFLITSRALDTDWFIFTLLAEFVHVTFGAGLPVAEQLTMTSLPSIISKGEEKLLLVISGPTFLKKEQAFIFSQSR